LHKNRIKMQENIGAFEWFRQAEQVADKTNWQKKQ
jgi:hypothetical protein